MKTVRKTTRTEGFLMQKKQKQPARSEIVFSVTQAECKAGRERVNGEAPNPALLYSSNGDVGTQNARKGNRIAYWRAFWENPRGTRLWMRGSAQDSVAARCGRLDDKLTETTMAQAKEKQVKDNRTRILLVDDHAVVRYGI